MKKIVFISIDPLCYRRRVLNQMRTAKTLGYQVTAITPGPDIGNDVAEKIHYIKTRYKRGPLRFFFYNLAILKLLKKQGPFDIIHARGLWVLPAIIRYRRKSMCRVVYDAHEYFAGHELFQKSAWRRLTWLRVEKRAIPLMDVLITVSEPLAMLYKERYPVLKKVEVIRNIPALVETDPPPRPTTSASIQLFFHGYFLPGRALLQIIDALGFLPDVNYKMTFLGEGPLEKQMRQRISNARLESKITFKPFVPSDKLMHEIAGADIGFCLIEADSLNRTHALPNKFFEYIHAGVPMLASTIPTLKALVEKHDVGRCCDPQDKRAIANTLRDMIGDTAARKKWRENCFSARKELNWQHEEKHLQAIYKELAGN